MVFVYSVDLDLNTGIGSRILVPESGFYYFLWNRSEFSTTDKKNMATKIENER